MEIALCPCSIFMWVVIPRTHKSTALPIDISVMLRYRGEVSTVFGGHPRGDRAPRGTFDSKSVICFISRTRTIFNQPNTSSNEAIGVYFDRMIVTRRLPPHRKDAVPRNMINGFLITEFRLYSWISCGDDSAPIILKRKSMAARMAQESLVSTRVPMRTLEGTWMPQG